MRIATYNVNGIRSRLDNLLAWLAREQPDVACLQELKAPDEAFPIEAIRAAGYDAIWHGQKSWNGVAILARGSAPVESRRGLPGGRDDSHSRYLEAAVQGVIVACLYLPNGNPQPGPKFDYKLAWFERLIRHAKRLYASGHPVVLAGDFNVVPTDFDIYNPRSWRKDALLQPESREKYAKLLAQGWDECVPVYLEFPGWEESTHGITEWDKLPAAARAYLRALEELSGCPLAMVSTGPDRDANIVLQDPWA